MAFFSEVETTFDFSASATGASARGTPTGPFLEASESILRLYDNLGSVAWKLIRSDFEAQMKTIRTMSEIEGVPGNTLQSIVLYEVKRNNHTDQGSATNALSWLCTHLAFLNRFMQEFCQTMYDVYTCLDTAYAQTLKNFHSFFDRGAVALALRSAPTREDFVLALQPRQFTVDGTVAEAEALLISHMTEYSKGLSAQLAKCKKLFVNLGLKDT